MEFQNVGGDAIDVTAFSNSEEMEVTIIPEDLQSGQFGQITLKPPKKDIVFSIDCFDQKQEHHQFSYLFGGPALGFYPTSSKMKPGDSISL